MKYVKNKDLVYLAYVQRENHFVHHTYDEESHIWGLAQQGDEAAIALAYQKFTGPQNGTLSQNPFRNRLYLFIVETAQVARACIHGGMPYQTAYGLSDLYVQKADLCSTIPQLEDLFLEMLSDYIRRMKAVKKETIYSKAVRQCMDYIDCHLHEKLTVPTLAEYVHLNPNYLSTLFKKHAGTSVSAYIRRKKLETAKNMLRYSDFSPAEISSILALGTQSHFTELLKADCGQTPCQYRNRYFEQQEQT